jgi:nicotinate (nicotinamide) nucleotide adenylyltransferase
MTIGLYFGSFNPIHHGHLIIANYMLQHTELDQVWFVVSPQNPFKQSASLLNAYHRLALVQLAIEQEPKLKASDIEFRLPQPSYTVDTLAYLQEKYPHHQFAIIMGSDSFENLAKWKNYEYILQHCPIYVYTRPGHEVNNTFTNARIIVQDAPLLQISATYIRNTIKQGKSIRYLVPDKVLEEIERNGYYR